MAGTTSAFSAPVAHAIPGFAHLGEGGYVAHTPEGRHGLRGNRAPRGARSFNSSSTAAADRASDTARNIRWSKNRATRCDRPELTASHAAG